MYIGVIELIYEDINNLMPDGFVSSIKKKKALIGSWAKKRMLLLRIKNFSFTSPEMALPRT